jgi:cob(I)alamin adenosyltransferase
VCRRAERAVVTLSAQSPVENVILSYLNRLSDYLYVLSRKIKQDFSIDEKPWVPK